MKIGNLLSIVAFTAAVLALGSTYWVYVELEVSPTTATRHLGLTYGCTEVKTSGAYSERKCEVLLSKGDTMKSHEAGEIAFYTLSVACIIGFLGLLGQELVVMRAQSMVALAVFVKALLSTLGYAVAWIVYAAIFFDSKEADGPTFGGKQEKYVPHVSFFLCVLASLAGAGATVLHAKAISSPGGETIVPNDLDSDDKNASDASSDLSDA